MKLARTKRGGFTLVEMLMSTGVCMLIMSALVSGAVAMQKMFSATEDYSSDKCAQMRLTDYIALDLRRALTVTAGTNGTTILSATIPDYYDTTGTARMPSVAGYKVNYGAAGTPMTITYTKQGSIIYRQENQNAPVEIANNVNDFSLTIQDLDKVVKTQITFAPKFKPFQLNASAAARTATTLYNTTLLRNARRDRT